MMVRRRCALVTGRRLPGTALNIPAVIEEAVKRAKLSQVRLCPRGVVSVAISPEAMLDAARSMSHQIELLNRRNVVEPSALEKGAMIIGNKLPQPRRKPGRVWWKNWLLRNSRWPLQRE